MDVIGCVACGSIEQVSKKNGMCRRCWLRKAAKKYHWTEAQDDLLRDIYRTSTSHKEFCSRLARFRELTGTSVGTVHHHATELGLKRYDQHPWTPIEIRYVFEHAGEMRVGDIAKVLHRSCRSVRFQLSKMHLSGRQRCGYTREELAQCLGTSEKTVRRWLDCGWIRLFNGRIAEGSVKKFLHDHPEQYALVRVDEHWFKGVVFDKSNVYYPVIVSQSGASA